MAWARDAEAFFAGAGELRALYRALDWSSTALGPVGSWPASLRMAVRLCLDARFPMAVWAGPDLQLIYNEGYPPVLGPAKHPWALGRPAREVWSEFWDRLGPELEHVLRGASTCHDDERFVLRRSGRDEEAFFTYSFTPVQEDDGRVVGALNVFMETTERVRSLGARNALLAAISDASGDAIFAKDRQGRMLFANPAALGLIGKPAERVLGSTDAEFLDDKDAARQVMKNDREVMDSGEPRQLEEVVRLPDGTPSAWLSLKTPYRDGEGRIIGLLGIAREITARKRSEDALRQAKERLEEEDRRKTQFLAVLSHELRNPLAPITNSLYVLEHTEAGSEQARRAQRVIGRQVAHLSQLVNELLDVTRITRNKIGLQRQRLQLDELVRRVVEDVRGVFDDAAVRLRLEVAAAPLFVNADPTRLAQVVGNLLNNAAKFSRPGGLTRVAIGRDCDEATLRVVDDGVGMSPETVAHLFEPFAQAEQSLDRSKGGLGLGLALVRGLVELHGGSVSAASAGIDKGAEFVVRLPLEPD